MAGKGPGKKYELGGCHSLRLTKAYISQEAIDWINSQDNGNEIVCRAVQFYYSYFNEADGIAERQPKGFIKKVQAKSTINEEANPKEAETSDIIQNEEVLGALSNMIESVRR